MNLPLAFPPARVCILRLSAIGDVCNVLPLVRTLQDAWPGTRFSWIVARREAQLLGSIHDIEFIVFDKGHPARSYGELWGRCRQQRFDVLVDLQYSFRALTVALLVRANVKLGFDRSNSRELHRLGITHRIPPSDRLHVVDTFFRFAETLGVRQRSLRWDIPIPPDARAYAERLIPDTRSTLVVSPCSTRELRNWSPSRYAAVIDHAAEALGMRVLLCGSRSAHERRVGTEILSRVHHPVTDLVGRDTLLQLLATLERATVLLAPDSGAAHMAAAAGCPVLGLYAATDPARSGPYLSREWCIDRHAEAAHRFLHRAPEELPWRHRIELPGVMDLITVADVCDRLDAIVETRCLTPKRRNNALTS